MSMYAGDPFICVKDPTTGIYSKNWQRLHMDSFSYKLSIETKDVINRRHEGYGYALQTVVIPKPPEIEFATKMGEARTALELVLNANSSIVSSTRKSVPNKTITIASSGSVYLDDTNIDPSTFNIKATGESSYMPQSMLAVDFILAHRDGFISLHPNSTLAPGEYDVAYECFARSGYSYRSGERPQSLIKIKGTFIDLATGENLNVIIPEVSISSETDFNLLSDDHVELKFKGSVVFDQLYGGFPIFERVRLN